MRPEVPGGVEQLLIIAAGEIRIGGLEELALMIATVTTSFVCAPSVRDVRFERWVSVGLQGERGLASQSSHELRERPAVALDVDPPE
ncbi:MAG: hypothetical protein V3U03_17505 [Myxococcota bacterium]